MKREVFLWFWESGKNKRNAFHVFGFRNFVPTVDTQKHKYKRRSTTIKRAFEIRKWAKWKGNQAKPKAKTNRSEEKRRKAKKSEEREAKKREKNGKKIKAKKSEERKAKKSEERKRSEEKRRKAKTISPNNSTNRG